jgi:hypothetical protein
MHCPACGQQQISSQTRFCSRCGLPLEPIAAYIADPNKSTALIGPKGLTPGTPRRHGLMQGLFIFLLSFLIVPLIAIISLAVNIEPWAVAISAILLGVGGVLRMLYALMFESGVAGEPTLEEKLMTASKSVRGGNAEQTALPSAVLTPAADYVSPRAGGWRDTNDLDRVPSSVADETTKLLSRDDS